MLQIKGQKWNTTQHSILVKSVEKNGVRFTGMMIVMVTTTMMMIDDFNPLNAELNPICHLLALLGAHHILHVSRIRDKKLQISDTIAPTTAGPTNVSEVETQQYQV